MHKWSESRRVTSSGRRKLKVETSKQGKQASLSIHDEINEVHSRSDSFSSVELKILGSDDDSGCSLEEFAWTPPNLKPELVKSYFSQIPKHKIPYVNSVGEKYRIRQMLHQLPPQDTEPKYCSGLTEDEEKELKMFAENRRQEAQGRGNVKQLPSSLEYPFACGNCKETIGKTELGIFAIRAGLQVCWHPNCFVCCVCKELLVDLVYFYKDDKLYCGRHHAESLKPRCSACDELIFADECTEAEQRAWHIQHFTCCECDTFLGGQRYIMRDGRPHCIICYDKMFATTCNTCHKTISVDEGEMIHEEFHWHATKNCFRCHFCHYTLLGRPFLPRDGKTFCSVICYGREQRRNVNRSYRCSKPPSAVPSVGSYFDSQMSLSLELKCLTESSKDNCASAPSDADTLSLSYRNKCSPDNDEYHIKRSPKSVFYVARGKNIPPVKPRPIRRVKSSPERQRPHIRLLSRSKAVNTDLSFCLNVNGDRMVNKGTQVDDIDEDPPQTPLVLLPIKEHEATVASTETKEQNRKSADIEFIFRSSAMRVEKAALPDSTPSVLSDPYISRSKSSSCILNRTITKEDLNKLQELLHFLTSKQLTLIPKHPQIMTQESSPIKKPLSKSSQLPRKVYDKSSDNSADGNDNYDWFIPGNKGVGSVMTESLNSVNLAKKLSHKLSKSCPPVSSGDGCSTCSSSSCDEEEFDAPLKRPFPPVIPAPKLPHLLPRIYSHSLPRDTNPPLKVKSPSKKRFKFMREPRTNCIVS